MLKDKGVIYIIILSLVVLVGLALFASNRDSGANLNSDIAVGDLDSLQAKKGFSFEQAVGKQAPDFSLESIDGSTVNLSDYRGKTVVLFFNEGSMCYPACWDQIDGFAKDERFNTDDIAVFSLVIDPKNEWEKIIKETQRFSNAQILFDTTKSVSLSYDILSLKSSMHPRTNPGHTYFIIDGEGVIRYAFDDPSMAVRNDVIFSELSKIKGG